MEKQNGTDRWGPVRSLLFGALAKKQSLCQLYKHCFPYWSHQMGKGSKDRRLNSLRNKRQWWCQLFIEGEESSLSKNGPVEETPTSDASQGKSIPHQNSRKEAHYVQSTSSERKKNSITMPDIIPLSLAGLQKEVQWGHLQLKRKNPPAVKTWWQF